MRYSLRKGPEAANYLCTQTTETLWSSAREEQLRKHGRSQQPEFNLWLDDRVGVIRTHLNLFDTASGRGRRHSML